MSTTTSRNGGLSLQKGGGGGLVPMLTYPRYVRDECGFRMALFFSAATLAGAFGGVLARGIAEMSGVGGKAAWAW